MCKSTQELISELMESDGISCAGLARIIGVPQSTMHSISTGAIPDPKASIVDALRSYECDLERRELVRTMSPRLSKK